MGMSTHIAGIRDPDSKEHNKMINAARALYDVGIYDLPKELKEYFKDYYETSEIVDDDYAGLEVDIKDAVKKSSGREACDEWVVDLRKLPKGVTHIRFTNSY